MEVVFALIKYCDCSAIQSLHLVDAVNQEESGFTVSRNPVHNNYDFQVALFYKKIWQQQNFWKMQKSLFAWTITPRLGLRA